MRGDAPGELFAVCREMVETIASGLDRAGRHRITPSELLRQLDENSTIELALAPVVVKVLDGHKVALIKAPNRAFSAGESD